MSDVTSPQEREPAKIIDPFKVVVVDPENMHTSLNRLRGRYLVLSEGEFNNNPVFMSEVTRVGIVGEDRTEPKYSIWSFVHPTDERRAKEDAGFYSAEKIDQIKNKMQERGVSTSVISREGWLRNLVAQKDGVAVQINLRSPVKLGSGDEFYLTEHQKRQITKGEVARENRVMWLELVDKDTLASPKTDTPALPADPEEFARQLTAYAEIYQAFLNAACEEEGAALANLQAIELKAD